MKHLLKRIIACTLLLALLMGIAPRITPKASAGGIDPEVLGYVSAGQSLRIDIHGDNMYSTTNLIFNCNGNTIATVVGYDESGDEVLNLNICTSDLLEYFVNATNGYYFECKVLYGELRITYNSANSSQNPTLTYTEHADKLDWVVKGNLQEIYLTVGDTAKLDVGEVADGYSARAESYNYSSTVAFIGRDGKIYAEAPGTTEVYMTCRVWISNTQYFMETVTCVVHVVEDYSLAASRASYYADPDEKYFNIVAYNKDGKRETGFDITVGDTTHNTGLKFWSLLKIPNDFTGTVTISKDGYIPYTLSAEHLQVSNVIMLCPQEGANPAIQAVWVRPEEITEYTNVKLQPIHVLEDAGVKYSISYDVFWNGHGYSNAFLQQGNVTIPLSSGGDTLVLGERFSSDRGPIYLHVLTVDGYTMTVPLMISVGSQIAQMEMLFGEVVAEEIDEEITAVGGNVVAFDLGTTIPIKYAIHHDGTVRGIIGVKFSGKTEEKDLLALYDEIRETTTKIKAADAIGDTEESNRLSKKLQSSINKRDAQLDRKYSTFGFEGNIGYMGYFDATLDDYELKVREIGMIANVQVSAVGSKVDYTTTIPHRWRVKFTENLEIMFSQLVGEQKGRVNLGVPVFKNKISLSGELSAGAFGTAEAAGTVTGSVGLSYPNGYGDFSDGVWTLDLNFHAGAKLYGKELLEFFDWSPIEGYQIYPRKSAAASLNITPVSLYDGADPAYNGIGTDQTTGGIAQTQTIKTDTYPDSQPQLARLENMDVLVWIDDNGQRTDTNRTCLYFAVYDHKTAVWSEPAPVGDDGFADFYPQLFTAGDALYVLWQKANTQLTDSSTLEETLLSMNVYVSAFDPAQGCFRTPECIHRDNALLDFMPQLRLIDGTLSSVWFCSGETLFPPEAECHLKKAVYTADKGWVEETICSIPGTPDGMAYGSDGSVCYTLNGVLYRVADGVPTAITNDTVTAGAPMYCQDILYYLADGVLTDGTVTIPLGEIVSNYRIFTREDGSPMAVVYYDFNDAGRQLYAVFASGDDWSEPVALTDEHGASFSGLSGFCGEDDRILLASNWIVTNETTGQESAQLRLITIPQVCDLTLTDADYLGTTLTRDGNVVTDLFLTNSGTAPIHSVQLSALDGETQLNSKAVSLTLLPGESTSVELSLPVAQISSDTLTFTAKLSSGTDVRQEDNTLTLAIASGDISVENMTAQMLPDGSVQASAMFINRGMTDLEGIRVVFTKNTSDGDVLTTMEVGSAAVGEVILVDCDLTGLVEGDLLYMTAVVDGTENYIANNTAFAQIGQMLTDSSTVTLSPDFKDANLELDTEYSTTLRSESPVTALFTPEASGYYWICLEAYRGIAESWTPAVDAEIYKEGDDFRYESLDFSSGGISSTITHFYADQHVYLEGGVTYSIQLSGNTGVLVKVTLKKVPLVTALHIDDITLTEGDHLSFATSVAEDANLTFTPSDSADDLTYTSSAPGVAEVDEYGYVIANAPGTAVITAVCRLSGAKTTFSVTVLPREADGVVTEGQSQYIRDGGYYAFTPSQTGYYHITFDDFFSVQMPGKDAHWVYCDDGNKSFLMEKGRTYTIRISNTGYLLIEGVTPEEMALEYSYNCDCYDCSGVMLYRCVPEKDMAVSLYYRSQNACSLVICDEDYQVITRLDTNSYTSDYLEIVLKAGKTYYIALEHDYSSRLGISEITGFLYTESGNDTVFVGDTEKFSMWISNDVDDLDTTLTLSSSDPALAKVNADGTVTFLREGTVTITGSTLEGGLVSSMTLNVQSPHKLTLDEPTKLTLDGVNTTAAMVSLTPEKSAVYVLTIHYQAGDGYWEYSFDMTERSGSEIECLNNENIPNGNTLTLKLEAGKTYDLRLYYYSYEMETPIDLTFLVTFADCDANGHSAVNDSGYDPGCDYPGLTAGSHCSVCGEVFEAQTEIPALGHSYRDGSCTRCGEADPDYEPPATDPEPTPKTDSVIRLAGADRFDTAFKAANELKTILGVEKFDSVVVASGAEFADALAGSYLAAVKEAPILLSFKQTQNEQVQAYIKENLAPGGTVYILGGTSAVPSSMEAGLQGLNVKRLAGANRFETNLLILKEAGVKAGDEILVCTGTEFADSLSASATGKPILLVYRNLTDGQIEYLKSLNGNRFCIVGGESAVPTALETAIKAYGETTRLAGKDRLVTSVMVAQKYFSNPEAAVVAYGWNYPDGLCGGPLAYAMDAPLILTYSKPSLYATAANYTNPLGIRNGYVLGGTGLVYDEAVRAIFSMATADVITLK